MTNKPQRRETDLVKEAVANAVMATNVEYIKNDIKEIKETLKGLSGQYVTNADFIEHLKVDADHENRIRRNETSITQVTTYGTAGVIALGILQFLVNKFL